MVAPSEKRAPTSCRVTGSVCPWSPSPGVIAVTWGATAEVGPQTLSTHCWPASQGESQPPQLLGSV